MPEYCPQCTEPMSAIEDVPAHYIRWFCVDCGEFETPLLRRKQPLMSDAMVGLADGRKGNKRPQEVLTPPEILKPLIGLWGGEIVLDPCGSRKWTFASHTIYEEDFDGKGGLAGPWVDRTYFNPPYKFLRTWLEHMLNHTGDERICGLAPVRTQRKWWRDAARQCSAVFELNPVTFVDAKTLDYYKGSYPPPLCLMFTNDDPDQVAKAFAGLGELRPRADTA